MQPVQFPAMQKEGEGGASGYGELVSHCCTSTLLYLWDQCLRQRHKSLKLLCLTAQLHYSNAILDQMELAHFGEAHMPIYMILAMCFSVSVFQFQLRALA